MFIKRDRSKTKREFDKKCNTFSLKSHFYERSNAVMMEFGKSLMRRNFCLDDFQKAKSFGYFDLEFNLKCNIGNQGDSFYKVDTSKRK